MNYFNELQDIFKEIKKKGYISVSCNNNDDGTPGKLFEMLINKKPDNKCKADYKGIEIKVINDKPIYPLTLFSYCPIMYNKTTDDTIKYLLNNYSYSVKNDGKKLVIGLGDGKIKYCKNGFGYMIKVSYNHKKIFLCIFYKKKLIDNSIYWAFDNIKRIIDNKIEKLALITYFSKKMQNQKFYYFSDINFYAIKSYEIFLNAIKTGIIKINFNISMDKIGKINYHGINFAINKNDIDTIYEKIQLLPNK